MTIKRGKRPEIRFYTLNKDISEDTRLSWAARGMLIFLLGKPDNWTVSVAHLIKQTAESARPSSRDAVRAVIAELVKAGYMRADTTRKGGKFTGIDYVVSELPETGNPATAKQQEPETDNPAPDEPTPEDTPLIKNDHQQGLKQPTRTDLTPPENCGVAGAENLPAVLLEGQQQPQASNEPSYEKIRERFWQWFDEAYQLKYNCTLPRNTKINAQVKQLIQRLGKEAPGVARFYVDRVTDPRVVMNSHTLDMLLANAEGYRSQWLAGRTNTLAGAIQADKTQTNANVAERAIARLLAREAEKNGD